MSEWSDLARVLASEYSGRVAAQAVTFQVVEHRRTLMASGQADAKPWEAVEAIRVRLDRMAQGLPPVPKEIDLTGPAEAARGHGRHASAH